jgi:predicted dehydrogenase
MKSDKLRVGVVGLMVGNGHVADYRASPSVGELVICDSNPARLQEVGDKHQVTKRYTDFAEMLTREKLDAVSIALPNKLHCPMTIQAIEAGCHVLCEKPMARNAGEALRMLEAARRYGKKLMINFNSRFTPYCQAVKEMIDSGRLGDIYFVRTLWHRVRGVPRWYNLTKDVCGGGALVDLGVHRLDLAMWLCGFPEPQWVLGNAFSKIEVQEYPDFELDDMSVAMIRMKNGAMLELEASWASNREGEEYATRIYGTKGGLLMRSGGNAKNQLFLELDGKLAHVDLVAGEFGNSPLAPPTNVRQAFLDAILNDTPVPCTPEQGLVINTILDAIYQSAQTGEPMKLAGKTGHNTP